MADDVEIDHEDKGAGERVSVAFPFDRMTVQRFREAFPRARWSDRRKAWIVPGTTARRRIDRWLAREDARVDPYAEGKGRDAYAFEPILSPYLNVDKDGFRIRTPFSRKVVEEIRQVPFARWDGEHKVWRVPFASYDDLVDRWGLSRRKRSEMSLKKNASAPRRAREPTRKDCPAAGRSSASAGASRLPSMICPR